MNRVPLLVDTIIRLQRRSQTDVSEHSGVHPSNLSKFLSGDTDIRSSSLCEILRSVGIDLEEILQNEIDRAMGRKPSASIGDALGTLIELTDVVTSKTLLDSLSKRFTRTSDKDVQAALKLVQEFKAKLKLERRHA